MSLRRKASIIVTGRKRSFRGELGKRMILVSASTTGSAKNTVKGTVFAQVGTTGATTGSVYLASSAALTLGVVIGG